MPCRLEQAGSQHSPCRDQGRAGSVTRGRGEEPARGCTGSAWWVEGRKGACGEADARGTERDRTKSGQDQMGEKEGLILWYHSCSVSVEIGRNVGILKGDTQNWAEEIMQERAHILSPEESLEAGERALLGAATEGMSREDRLEAREVLRSKGVPEKTLQKLFPDPKTD